MIRTTAEILAVATGNMDAVFVDRDDGADLLPLLASGAAALSMVEADTETQVASALPSDAAGEWLRLLARGLGVNPNADESDDDLRARLAGGVTYGTPAAIKDAVDKILGDGSSIVVDGLQLTLFCDPDPTMAVEHITDAFCDNLTLLPAYHGFVVLCPEGLTESQRRAIVEACDVRRVSGTSAWAVFSDDYLAGATYAWPGEPR